MREQSAQVWEVWKFGSSWFAESRACNGDPEGTCECRAFATWREAQDYADRMARADR